MNKIPHIIKRASISGCGTYRHWLTRQWGPNRSSRVCWIMLNPSTADHQKDDPTLLRIIKFSQSWGYDGLIVVNLYPFRSSSPKKCKSWLAAGQVLGRIDSNLVVLANAVEFSSLTMAAWGNGADWDTRIVANVLGKINSTPPTTLIHCLGTTRAGNPKHPLARGKHRVTNDQQPVPWNAPNVFTSAPR